MARARRIGQTAARVFSHNLLVADTIDTRLAEIIDEKRAVTTAVTEGTVLAQLLGSIARGTL